MSDFMIYQSDWVLQSLDLFHAGGEGGPSFVQVFNVTSVGCRGPQASRGSSGGHPPSSVLRWVSHNTSRGLISSLCCCCCSCCCLVAQVLSLLFSQGQRLDCSAELERDLMVCLIWFNNSSWLYKSALTKQVKKILHLESGQTFENGKKSLKAIQHFYIQCEWEIVLRTIFFSRTW